MTEQERQIFSERHREGEEHHVKNEDELQENCSGTAGNRGNTDYHGRITETVKRNDAKREGNHHGYTMS